MLGDAASFASGDVGQPNGIQQSGFAVIDVAHDGDHRRPRYAFGTDASSPAAESAISFAACSSNVITLVSAPKKRAISLASSVSSV